MPSPGMLSPSVAHRTRRQHVGQNPSENQGGPNWVAYQAQAAAAAQAHAAAQQRNIQLLPDGSMHVPNTEQNMQLPAQPPPWPPSHASDNSLGSLQYGFAQVSTASNHTALPYPPATPNLGAGSSESAPTRPGVSTPLRKTAGEKYPSTRKHLRTIEVRLTCCYDLNKVTSLLRTASRAFFADARANWRSHDVRRSVRADGQPAGSGRTPALPGPLPASVHSANRLWRAVGRRTFLLSSYGLFERSSYRLF